MLTINNQQYAPLAKASTGAAGYYKQTRKGVYLYDSDKSLFAYMQANARFTGAVSASKRSDGKTWFMHDLCDSDSQRLGFDGLSYSQERQAVAELISSIQH